MLKHGNFKRLMCEKKHTNGYYYTTLEYLEEILVSFESPE